MQAQVLRAMLHDGDLITRFEGTTVEGREVPYDQLWQRLNVVLFVLPRERGTAASRYLQVLEHRLAELKPPDTALVISRQAIDGLPVRSVAITDRWGEVVHVEPPGTGPGDVAVGR